MTITTKYVALRLMSDRIDDTVSELAYAKHMLGLYETSPDIESCNSWDDRAGKMKRRYRRQMKAFLRIANSEVQG